MHCKYLVYTYVYINTTPGDGRLAAHLHMLICRVMLGPFAKGVVPYQLSINGAPMRREPTKQNSRINFMSLS